MPRLPLHIIKDGAPGNRPLGKTEELLTMFLSFFKIGAFTIGGGYAMLPLMEQEFVQHRKWVDPVEMVDVFAVAQSLPGVIAINASIYIGYKIDRIRGAVVAALGVILPSFLIILGIAAVLLKFQEYSLVQKAFAGVRAGVTALILLSGVKLGKVILKNRTAWIIGVGAFLLLVVGKIQAVVVILASGLIGLGTFVVQKRIRQREPKKL